MVCFLLVYDIGSLGGIFFFDFGDVFLGVGGVLFWGVFGVLMWVFIGVLVKVGKFCFIFFGFFLRVDIFFLRKV